MFCQFTFRDGGMFQFYPYLYDIHMDRGFCMPCISGSSSLA